MQSSEAGGRVLVGIILVTLFVMAIGLLMFAIDGQLQPVQAREITLDY